MTPCSSEIELSRHRRVPPLRSMLYLRLNFLLSVAGGSGPKCCQPFFLTATITTWYGGESRSADIYTIDNAPDKPPTRASNSPIFYGRTWTDENAATGCTIFVSGVFLFAACPPIQPSTWWSRKGLCLTQHSWFLPPLL